jgi:hypothetical protein
LQRYHSAETQLSQALALIDERRLQLKQAEEHFTLLMHSNAKVVKLVDEFWIAGGVTQQDFEAWRKKQWTNPSVPTLQQLRLVVDTA